MMRVEPSTTGTAAARNQALFRAINERIQAMNVLFNDVTPYVGWTCECSTLECTQHVQLTIDEYEAVRSHPRRFFVAPNEQHVLLADENVVERHQRYWVVEKLEDPETDFTSTRPAQPDAASSSLDWSSSYGEQVTLPHGRRLD